MNKITLYSFSLIFSTILVFIGATMKILHLTYSNIIIPLGMIISLIYICIGLYDSFMDKKDSSIVKLMWLVGFIFLSFLAGILYFPKLKKNQTIA
jgi:hypothetical protein